MKRWGLRLVLVAAMAFAVAPGSSVWADEGDEDKLTGIANACDGPAGEPDRNPHCESIESAGGDERPGKPPKNDSGAPPVQEDDEPVDRGQATQDCLDDDDSTECSGPKNSDTDLVPDQWDNCRRTENPDQFADSDDDGVGDACDNWSDKDGDGVQDANDNCPDDRNGNQANGDGDEDGDVCDSDRNDNGIPDGPVDDRYQELKAALP